MRGVEASVTEGDYLLSAKKCQPRIAVEIGENMLTPRQQRANLMHGRDAVK
jgi:hypothetical protein